MIFPLGNQNVPPIARVAARAFEFLTLIQFLDGPERYGAFSFLKRAKPTERTTLAVRRH